MALFKCKMCGGNLDIVEGTSVTECEYCGSKQTVPAADNEKKITLFGRANRLLFGCEFDKAAGVFESIVSEFPEEAEAYWGLVLCKYGIEYVDDSSTGKKIPTCHRSSFDSIIDDSDFEQVLENADAVARAVYREEAKKIEELRKGIIEVSAKEEPYDIFICYKETALDGNRTVDSVLAQDVYTALTEKGYRVFFSRISLEDKLGVAYEPYIFAALNSAKIMLTFGTDYEYFNAVWVKNEWSRFLQLIAKGEKKTLIPCYKGIDAYDLPKEFAKLQAQDMGKVGAIQDLLRGIEKILPKEAVGDTRVVSAQQAGISPTVASLLKRAFNFLEDEEWQSAIEYCNKVLDIDPENADAYLGKLMGEDAFQDIATLSTERLLAMLDNTNYKRLLQYAGAHPSTAIQNFLAKAPVEIDGLLYTYDKKIVLKATSKHIDKAIILDGTTEIAKKCFFKCELKTVQIPDSVTKIHFAAFCDCENLTDLTIPPSVRYIGSEAFSGCKNLTLTDSTIRASDIGMFAFNNCCKLSHITLEDSVTYVGLHAFKGCTKLSSIIISSSLLSNSSSWDVDSSIIKIEKNDLQAKQKEQFKKRQLQRLLTEWAEDEEYKLFAITHNGKFSSKKHAQLENWFGLIAISADEHIVGLRADGTTVAMKGSSENKGQCNITKWHNIEDIAVGRMHTVGLQSNHSVVATGGNEYGQCNVSSWKNIVSIAAGLFHTVGLKSDGTVVAIGSNDEGQCNVSNWQNIVAISAGEAHTVGLKADGTVIATGDNSEGQCNVRNWTHIISISASTVNTVGLRADGTVIVAGNNDDGQCKTQNWRDIIAVYAGRLATYGLKANGTLVAVGVSDAEQHNISQYRLFEDLAQFEDSRKNLPKQLEKERELAKKRQQEERELAQKRQQEERKRAEELAKLQASRRSQNLCQHCGGTFKGLFTKTCSACGKKKDY